ncbi:MAG: tetratricopeptide repeat protein [Bacteroidales bacterium]|nr:tetratricopeptide repeat protein [Bacteroidales bacterium]
MSNDRFKDYDSEVKQLVLRFEQTVLNGQQPFFDVDQLEIIIDYYLENGNIPPLSKAIAYAERLYPDSNAIRRRRAQLLVARQQYDDAIDMLNTLKQLEPDNTDIDYALGVAYGASDRHHEAIACFLRAAADGWELGRVYANIAEEYYRMANDDRAILYYNKALSTDTFDAATVADFYDTCRGAGKTDSAMGTLRSLTERQPYCKEAWFFLGLACASMGQYEQAIEAFELALTIDRTYTEVYVELSYVHEELGHFTEAADTLKHAIDDLDDPEARQNHMCMLANLYARHNNLAVAVSYYRRVLEQNPNNVDAISSLGLCYIDLGDRSAAEQYIERALAIDPHATVVLYNAAVVCDLTGQIDRARELYNELLESAECTEQHGQVYVEFLYRNDFLDEAISRATEMLSVYPHDSFYSTFLMAAYFRQNRYNNALSLIDDADLNMARQVCPEMTEHPLFASFFEEE